MLEVVGTGQTYRQRGSMREEEPESMGMEAGCRASGMRNLVWITFCLIQVEVSTTGMLKVLMV